MNSITTNRTREHQGGNRLDHNGTNYHKDLEIESKQSVKHQAKHKVSTLLNLIQKTIQTLSCKKGVRDCGKYSTKTSVAMRISNNGGNARFCGLNRCLNTTICARCSHILSVQRAKQIDEVAKPLIENGGSGFMLTLTIPHHRGDDFKMLQRSLNKCWAEMMRSKFGRDIGKFNTNKKPLWVKAFDYTFTKNGDHLHFHTMILMESSVSDGDYNLLQETCYKAWLRLVKKHMGRDGNIDAIKMERVYDVEGVSKYNDKISSVAFEIASRGTTKRSNGTSLNIWELIWEIRTTEDSTRREMLIKKFKMFEKQTHKLRTITFSKCFREKIGEFDEDMIKEEQDKDSTEVLKIRTDLWKLIQKNEDTINLLELYNCYTTGDDHLAPLVKAVERVCAKYGEDTENFDEEQMKIDWGQVSFRINAWLFYRFKPEYYQHHHSFLV